VTGPAPVLAAEDVVAGYEPGLPIVRGVSLAVRPGEIVALLGPNGAGKSTLVRALAGVVPLTAGRVTLAGREVGGLPAHERARAGLGFVPQTENVFAGLTVDENLELAGFALARSARRARVTAMRALFPDLARQARLPAGRLSGGQRQMLAIARALLVEPAVLLLDEPSAGLSPRLAAEVFATLRGIRARGVAVVVVEQNTRAALALADRASVLVEGRERAAGPAAALRADPELARLYLGGGPRPGGPGARAPGAAGP
jgi:branched-chain amino acid transport system ATP-binding protein